MEFERIHEDKESLPVIRAMRGIVSAWLPHKRIEGLHVDRAQGGPTDHVELLAEDVLAHDFGGIHLHAPTGDSDAYDDLPPVISDQGGLDCVSPLEVVVRLLLGFPGRWVIRWTHALRAGAQK